MTTLTHLSATLEPSGPDRWLLILNTQRGQKAGTDLYHVTRHACANRAYRLTKLDPAVDGTDREAENYDVNLDECSCDCKGHCRWGECKHRMALEILQEQGELP